MEKPIQCKIFGDCLPWEQSYFQAFAAALGASTKLTVLPENTQVSEGSAVWMISRDWRAALKTLPPRHKGPVFVSLLEARQGERLLGLFPRYWNPVPTLDVRLVAHASYTSRFFVEMERVPAEYVVELPLPGLFFDSRPTSKETSPLRVGCLVPPNADANLNFVVSVAHYVARSKYPVEFVLPMSGRFALHLEAMAADLGLSRSFSRLSDVGESIDLLLHAPMKAESFIPVLWMGGQGVPVLSTDVPGIETLLSDGRDGFILPVNDVRPVGELIVRLAESQTLRESLGDRLRQGLAKRFPLDRVLAQYLELFRTRRLALNSLVAA